MHHHPGQPGQQAAHLQPADFGYRLAAPDGRHDAGVVIGECLRLAATEDAQQVARRALPLLDRHRRDHRQRAAVRAVEQGCVADDKNLGMPFCLQGGQNHGPPQAALFQRQRVKQTGGLDPCRPDQRACRNDFPTFERDLPPVEAFHRGAKAHLHPLGAQRPLAEARQAFGQRGQQPVLRLQQDHLRLRQVQTRVIARQDVADQFRNRPGAFHPARPAARHREGQQRRAARGVVLVQRQLAHRQQVIADRLSVFHRFEPKRAFGLHLRAEGMGGAARRQDQIIISQRPAICVQHPRLQVRAAHAGDAKLQVILPAQDGAHRLGDLIRRQPGRGHLVEQGLEEVIVVAVQQGDAHRSAGQRLRGAQPAESGSDDHDMRYGVMLGIHRFLRTQYV